MWKTKNPKISEKASHKRKEFLLQQGQELIKPHVERRLQNPMGLTNQVLNAMHYFVSPLALQPTTTIDNKKTIGRCVFCPQKIDRKS